MFMLRDLLRLSVDEHLGFILVLVWRHFGFMDVFKNVWDGKLQVVTSFACSSKIVLSENVVEQRKDDFFCAFFYKIHREVSHLLTEWRRERFR